MAVGLTLQELNEAYDQLAGLVAEEKEFLLQAETEEREALGWCRATSGLLRRNGGLHYLSQTLTGLTKGCI